LESSDDPLPSALYRLFNRNRIEAGDKDPIRQRMVGVIEPNRRVTAIEKYARYPSQSASKIAFLSACRDCLYNLAGFDHVYDWQREN